MSLSTVRWFAYTGYFPRTSLYLNVLHCCVATVQHGLANGHRPTRPGAQQSSCGHWGVRPASQYPVSSSVRCRLYSHVETLVRTYVICTDIVKQICPGRRECPLWLHIPAVDFPAIVVPRCSGGNKKTIKIFFIVIIIFISIFVRIGLGAKLGILIIHDLLSIAGAGCEICRFIVRWEHVDAS